MNNFERVSSLCHQMLPAGGKLGLRSVQGRMGPVQGGGTLYTEVQYTTSNGYIGSHL